MSLEDYERAHLRRHELELAALEKIASLLAESTSQPELLTRLLEILERDLRMQRGTIMLLSGDGATLDLEAVRASVHGVQAETSYRRGEGIIGRVCATGEAVIVPLMAEEPNFRGRIHKRPQELAAGLSFICIPIVADGQVVGTLSVDLPSRELEVLEEDQRFLSIIGLLIAKMVKSRRQARLEREQLENENRRLRDQLTEIHRPENILGNSEAMRQVYSRIHTVARSDTTTVLITGESGTGKELVASAVHYASQRAKGPFIKVNCAALSENLLESELFGHEKGAFTGALYQRLGRFEEAGGGTLFLDEIGDFSPTTQVKLLRALQERQFERVGSNKTLQANVRVIAATHKDLVAAVRSQSFRQDLYYRINVFPIHLPPLRERNQDILLLADHFAAVFARRQGKEVRRISTSAIEMLLAYHWPGNVRELENCIEYAVLLSQDGVIHGYNLPPSLQMPTAQELGAAGTLKARTAVLERDMVVDALKRNAGNISAAARELGITARMVRYKLGTLGIDYRQLFPRRKRSAA